MPFCPKNFIIGTPVYPILGDSGFVIAEKKNDGAFRDAAIPKTYISVYDR